MSPRSNSFSYLFIDEWKFEPDAGCPIYDGRIGTDDSARSIFVLSDGVLRLYKTDTADMSEEEIEYVKRETGQIYLDVAGKTSDIDFQRDLVKMNRWPGCLSCANEPWCPCIYTAAVGEIVTPAETGVVETLERLAGRILDVGCGKSHYPEIIGRLIEEGRIDYTGIDPAAGEQVESDAPALRILKSAIEEYSDEENAYDAVLVLRSHNHFADMEAAYGNIGKLLKPGGLLLIVDNTVFGVVRPKGFVQRPAGPEAPSQHYRNHTSWDVFDALDGPVWRVREHIPVRPDGFNQWLISFEKRVTAHVDVLIVNPPILLHEDFVDYPYFVNLGVLQNAAVLEKAGFSVRVADSLSIKGGELARENDSYYRLGAPVERLLAEIEDVTPKIIVVALNSFNYMPGRNPFVGDLTAALRKKHPDAPLALADFYFGGMHYIDESATATLEKYPEAGFLLKYECENTLPELAVGLLKRGGACEPETRVMYGNPAEVKLQDMPSPDWSMIHIEQYQKVIRSVFEKTRRPMLFEPVPNTFPAYSSRGCVYDCVFCTHDPGMKRGDKRVYRTVPPDELERSFTELKDKHYAKKIVILDGLANFREKHFAGLIRLMNELGLEYDFPNGLRADKLKRSHLEMMAGRIGTLSISAESGSQAVVDEIVAKRQSLESVERVARWCSELGIPLLIHYLIGLPGEGLSEINETLRHAWRMSREYGAGPSVQFAVPLPGARLHEICVEKGLLPPAPVENYAPFFSGKPLMEPEGVPAGALARMKRNFDLRMSVARTRKVIVNLTYECNNNCRFCAIGKRDKKKLDYEIVCAFLEKYRGEGVKLADFDGGEPTLHPDLLEIIGTAREMGYERINVTTNGRRLADRGTTARLLLSGITDLLVSIHGHNAEVHDYHTTHPGSFDESLRGLRNAVRLKPDRIDLGVNTTLTKVNAPHLEEFAELLAAEGVKKLNVQFITPFGNIERNIVPDPAVAAGFLKRVIDKYADIMKIQVVNLPFCFMEGYEEYLVSDVYKNERNMVFVSAEDVNLAEWLTAGRRRAPRCAECVHAIVCDGEYQFDVIGV